MSRVLLCPFATSTKTAQIRWLLSHTSRYNHTSANQQPGSFGSEYVPSSMIQKVAQAANIGCPGRWRSLRFPPAQPPRSHQQNGGGGGGAAAAAGAGAGKKAPKTSAGGVQVATIPQHVFHPWHMRYFDRHGHALAESMLKRYLARTDPLWWFVTVHGDSTIPDSAFVKRAMRKRAEHAFRVALERRGWDAEGRRIAGRGGHDGLRELYGSVRINGVLKMLLHLRFEEVVASFEQAVKSLEELLGKGAPGASGERPSSPSGLGEVETGRPMASKSQKKPRKFDKAK